MRDANLRPYRFKPADGRHIWRGHQPSRDKRMSTVHMCDCHSLNYLVGFRVRCGLCEAGFVAMAGALGSIPRMARHPDWSFSVSTSRLTGDLDKGYGVLSSRVSGLRWGPYLGSGMM